MGEALVSFYDRSKGRTVGLDVEAAAMMQPEVIERLRVIVQEVRSSYT